MTLQESRLDLKKIVRKKNKKKSCKLHYWLFNAFFFYYFFSSLFSCFLASSPYSRDFFRFLLLAEHFLSHVDVIEFLIDAFISLIFTFFSLTFFSLFYVSVFFLSSIFLTLYLAYFLFFSGAEGVCLCLPVSLSVCLPFNLSLPSLSIFSVLHRSRRC